MSQQNRIRPWQWPLPGVDKLSSYQGSFGAVRKYDVHCGVDLYCEPHQLTVAVEDGIVVGIEKFTGEFATPSTSWWNDTYAVLVEGASGVVVYGEIEPTNTIQVGKKIRQGQTLGYVITVLKKDKGLPMTMLHLELHKPGTKETVTWNLNEPRPESLLDPSDKLGDKMWSWA